MKQELNVVVCGGRDFEEYDTLKMVLDDHFENLFKDKDITIISGGARGADTLAIRYAEENNVPYKVFPAQWDKYGRSAGYIRNAEMAEIADRIIAFEGGNGTKNMMELGEKKDIPVLYYNKTVSLLVKLATEWGVMYSFCEHGEGGFFYTDENGEQIKLTEKDIFLELAE